MSTLKILPLVTLLMFAPVKQQPCIQTLASSAHPEISIHMSVQHDCHLTAEQLESGLLYDLKPYAQDYIDAAQETGICPVFLAAKDALESGWGRYMYQPNNISGWYTANHFGSVTDCIRGVSRALEQEYLTPNGRYYHGNTIANINYSYNGDPFWETEVVAIMKQINQRINDAQHNSEV